VIAGAPRSDNEGKHRTKNSAVRHFVGRPLRRVSDLAAAERPRGILEAGCGEGMPLATLLATGLPRVRLEGLELDETALEGARAVPALCS